MTIAEAIVESYKKWERKPADLYPTPVDGTESIIPVLEVLRETLGVKRIWEPACGDGRMARVLEWHDFEVIASDLRRHSGYGTGGIDFLAPRDTEGVDMIVSNPPFSLAEQFIRRALAITPNVAMLVKISYYNAAKRIGLFAELRPRLFLPVTWRLAFLKNERGNSPLMDCAWVVWCHDPSDDGKVCAFEPLPKIKYPGYPEIGVLSSLDILEGEMEALAEALRGLL